MKNQNKRISHKLVSGIVSVILLLAVCFCIFAFVQKFNKGYVSFLGYSLFRVTTGSMEPTISVGELILTQDMPIEKIETKDIISFFSKDAYMNGRIITHRVVERDISVTGQVMLTTRGDSNPSTDIHRVDDENFIGKVIWISGDDNAFAGVMNFLSSGMGFFTCIAIPVILISVLIFKRCIAVMMIDIKRFKDECEISKSEDKEDADNAATELELTEQDYEEMRAKIRAELIEELKIDDNGDDSKTE